MDYVVFLELPNGTFIPISYGDSELECTVWLQEHKRYQNEKVYIGYRFSTVVQS